MFKKIVAFILLLVSVSSLVGCYDYEEVRAARIRELNNFVERLERESAIRAEEAANRLEQQALEAPSDNP